MEEDEEAEQPDLTVQTMTKLIINLDCVRNTKQAQRAKEMYAERMLKMEPAAAARVKRLTEELETAKKDLALACNQEKHVEDLSRHCFSLVEKTADRLVEIG
jgi:hypothetical protein